MSRRVIVAVIAAGVLASCQGGGSVNREIAAACRDGRIKADLILESWARAGVVLGVDRSDSTARVRVDTSAWHRNNRDAQMSIGLAAYCQILDRDGRGLVKIIGTGQNELASVVNGHWMD